MENNQDKLSEDLNGWGWLVLAIIAIAIICYCGATVWEAYFIQ